MLNRKNKKTWGFEKLEDRQLMAGDIAAVVQNGDLIITENAAQVGQDNNVLIQGLANGQVRVSAVGKTGAVNGQAYRDFTVTGSLRVDLGAGNDTLQIGLDADGAAAMAPKFNNVDIKLGGITPGNITRAYNDADQLLIHGLTTKGTVNIDTGVDADKVHIGGKVRTGSVTIGDGQGIVDAIGDDLNIKTGAGADEVNVFGGVYKNNLTIETFANLAENDADRVRIDRGAQVTLDVNVRLGGGADAMNIMDETAASAGMAGLTTGGLVDIDAGAGDDTLYLRNFTIGQPGDSNIDSLEINAGAGADTLTIKNDTGFARVADDVYIQMYEDIHEQFNDRVNVDGLRAQWQRFWGSYGADEMKLTNLTAQFVQIDTDGGVDHVTVENSMIYNHLMAEMGEGDDTLTVTGVTVRDGGAFLYGGAGYDTLNISRSNFFLPLTAQEWELFGGINQPLTPPRSP